MRILVLLPGLLDSLGGIQTYHRCLIKALDEISIVPGFEIYVYVLNDKPKGNYNSFVKSNRVKISGFGRNKSLFFIASVISALSSNSVILGHINFIYVALCMFGLGKQLTKYLMVYGVDVWKRLSFLQRIAVARVDTIIAISNFTKNEMIKHNDLKQDKFFILPCTLDPFYEEEDGVVPSVNLPNGKIILTVSRLSSEDKYKNIDKVIEAMPLILNELPDAYYVIVGDGSDRKRLEDLAHKLNLGDRVIFAGRVSEVALKEYYKRADVFVLVSLLEGFGIVFLEAMYYGVPCVGVRFGGIPEVIDDKKSGCIVSPNNHEELVKAVSLLLVDKSLCKQYGQCGKDKLEQYFLFDKYKKNLGRLLLTN